MSGVSELAGHGRGGVQQRHDVVPRKLTGPHRREPRDQGGRADRGLRADRGGKKLTVQHLQFSFFLNSKFDLLLLACTKAVSAVPCHVVYITLLDDVC